MKIFKIAMCAIILLCVTGCADTAGSQNDMAFENPSPASEALSAEASSDMPVVADASDEEALDESEEAIPEELSAESEAGSEVFTGLVPAVMIDGTVYYLSQGYPIPDSEVDSDQVEYTESEVPLGTYPEKDGESNYAPAGTPYVKHGNGYALKMEKDSWSLFLTWEDRLAEE